MAVTNEQGVFVLADQEGAGIQALERELREASMIGEWQIQRKPEPDPGGVPYLWSWDLIYDKMLKATAALDLGQGARRSLLCINPGLPNQGTILSMRVGLQMISPGEIARAHQHTMSAIRFVVRSNPKCFTVVKGERLHMEDWSLIVTPHSTLHHHENHSDENVIWLDAIDTPFVKSVNALFYQPYEDATQPFIDPAESVSSRTGWLRPTWQQPDPDVDERGFPVAYRWADTERALKSLEGAPGSPHDGIMLEYVNPVTGGPAVPTFSCSIQMLRPGEVTRSHQHTSGAVYHVLRGHGETRVGNTTLEWGTGDTFVVPNWAMHGHRNLDSSSDALMFVLDDRPILKAVKLYRERSGE